MSPLEFVEEIVSTVDGVTTKVSMELPRAYFNELKEEVSQEYEDCSEARITSEKILNQTFSIAELYLHQIHFTFYIKD